MPPRKVYGKSRAVYDPFGIFDSPQRPTPTSAVRSRFDVPAQKLHESNTRDDSTAGDGHGRRALEEVNVNATVLPSESKSKPKARRRRKQIVEDSNSENEEVEGSENRECTDVAVLDKTQHEDLNNGHCEPTGVASGASVLIDEQVLINGRDPAEGTEDVTPEKLERTDVFGQLPSAGDEYSRHCSELLEVSLHHEISTFSEWSDALTQHFNITKIAEASFSEVYRLSLLRWFPDLSHNDESVFKVIPLRPPESTLPKTKRKREAALKKMESMSLPEHVANEVRLLLRMGNIPGFTNFRDVRVLKGRPPKIFAKAFKDFNARQKQRNKELSVFPDPAKKSSYSEDQLWAVIEMQDAGMDLERLVEFEACTSIWLVWDIFWQVVLSLAKGEENAEFEHRDLHLGNICIRSPDAWVVPWSLKQKLNFTGYEATIIDYTISRAKMQDGTIAYHDLAQDPALFEGDSTEEYQYDIYRYMRGAVLQKDPFATYPTSPPQDDTWKQHHPVTNLIWLHFILHKLLEQLEFPSAKTPPPKRQKDKHAKWKRANDLEHILLRVRDLLNPEQICQSLLESASDLVGLALRECWLDYEDVVEAGADETGLMEEFDTLRLDAGTPDEGEDGEDE